MPKIKISSGMPIPNIVQTSGCKLIHLPQRGNRTAITLAADRERDK
jgi:hypothetical protein